MTTIVTLMPHRWTSIPDTNLAILWEGDGAVSVRRTGGFWDLTPLSQRPGHVLAWARVVRHGRPVTPPWPLVALAHRATYRSAAASDGQGHRNCQEPGLTGG